MILCSPYYVQNYTNWENKITDHTVMQLLSAILLRSLLQILFFYRSCKMKSSSFLCSFRQPCDSVLEKEKMFYWCSFLASPFFLLGTCKECLSCSSQSPGLWNNTLHRIYYLFGIIYCCSSPGLTPCCGQQINTSPVKNAL